jgi:hypothetical protein
VRLLAVDALEISRRKAGRSGCGAEARISSSTVVREVEEAWVLALGEGWDEGGGVERGMGEE